MVISCWAVSKHITRSFSYPFKDLFSLWPDGLRPSSTEREMEMFFFVFFSWSWFIKRKSKELSFSLNLSCFSWFPVHVKCGKGLDKHKWKPETKSSSFRLLSVLFATLFFLFSSRQIDSYGHLFQAQPKAFQAMVFLINVSVKNEPRHRQRTPKKLAKVFYFQKAENGGAREAEVDLATDQRLDRWQRWLRWRRWSLATRLAKPSLTAV